MFFLAGCGDAVCHVSGRVQDSYGAPLENAAVRIAPSEDSNVEASPDEVVTGPTGKFFVGITFAPSRGEQTFTLRVQREGFRSHTEPVREGVHRRDLVLQRDEE
jgi:hypothetical protein